MRKDIKVNLTRNEGRETLFSLKIIVVVILKW